MPAGQSFVVVGGGIAGLVAARTLARKGFRVTLVEASTTPGGCVATHAVAGIRLDSGAESFATRGGTVATYLEGLGLGAEVVSPNPSGAWVQLEGDAAPLPKNTVLGIPGVPLADDVRRIIGWSGVLRAQLDRYSPLVRVRKQKSLGDLVRRRMGQKVLDRLVAPIVSGVHSAHPDLVDIDAVAPGLLAAMEVQGSLSGAVLSLIARRPRPGAAGAAAQPARPAEARAPGGSPSDAQVATGTRAVDDGAADASGRPGAQAGSAVGGIDGGMFRLVEALVADCERFGVDLRFGVGVSGIRRVDMSHAPTAAPAPPATLGDVAMGAEGGVDGAAGGREALENGDEGADSALPQGVGAGAGGHAAEWMTVLDDGAVLGSNGVVVAAGFRAALGLLKNLDGLREQTVEAEWPGSSAVTLATLVLDAPELDAAPRGTGVLVAEDVTTVRAKALTHATAKWPWLADAAGPGRHVVRLSYGRGGENTGSSGPVVTQADALRDATTLLGVPLDEAQVRGFALAEWRDSLAFATTGHRARVDALVEAVHEHPGLEVVGAWISGTGLAYVIDGTSVKASELAVSLLST